MILTIDPGVHGCGCALWYSTGVLERAAYVRPATAPRDIAATVRETAWAVENWVMGDELTRVVIEYPQTYRGRAARGDANDLVQVALVAGALSVLTANPALLVLPAEWKGQAPKHATEARARKKLGDLAARVLLPGRDKKLASNVWDAVGIGLWYFGVNKAVDKPARPAHG